MASGDFLDLQTQLAQLAGHADPANLDGDLNLCKQVINEALLEVYRPVDREGNVLPPPEWARRTITLQFRAPQAVTLGVTNGSRVVTGYVFPADFTGSLVKIGTNYYRYAGLDGADHTLVEPVMEATGSTTATLYHACQPIAQDVSEVLGGVEWQGHGLLSPMTDRETEIGYRSNIWGDYHPSFGAGYYGGKVGILSGTAYPTGDPMFYRIETDALLEGADVLRRFCVVPIPEGLVNIAFRASIVPTELVNNSDRPKIVADLVTRCLLPIAREKWGALYKKYTGTNLNFLVREADKARAILGGVARPQRRTSGQCRPGLR
jgi:hypothetical protein